MGIPSVSGSSSSSADSASHQSIGTTTFGNITISSGSGSASDGNKTNWWIVGGIALAIGALALGGNK